MNHLYQHCNEPLKAGKQEMLNKQGKYELLKEGLQTRDKF
jgi:hypothetical protein